MESVDFLKILRRDSNIMASKRKEQSHSGCHKEWIPSQNADTKMMPPDFSNDTGKSQNLGEEATKHQKTPRWLSWYPWTPQW